MSHREGGVGARSEQAHEVAEVGEAHSAHTGTPDHACRDRSLSLQYERVSQSQ